MDVSFGSALMILLLVTDPLGNIPLFVALLKPVDPARRPRVILRECAIALTVLIVCIFAGDPLLSLLGVSDRSLNIAGGVILFVIALHMVFRSAGSVFGDAPAGEPFIVPLAIPAIAGPTAIATVILLASRAPQRLLEWTAAVCVAIAVTLMTMLFAERLARKLGEHGLAALERLMGLVLTAVAVEMILRGVEEFVRGLS